MRQTIPTVSLPDNLFYNFVHVLPYYLQGIFTRSKFWVGIWSRFHPDPLAVKFSYYLRKKYKSDYLYLYMLANKTLFVMDRDGIKRVLDNSPAIYADARLKRLGMSHFQPHALTISRGEEWWNRRQFNEAVLNAGHGPHQHADQFLEIIRREIDSKRRPARSRLTWSDFDDLFEKITLQIIFGQAARDDTALWDRLKRMLRESNRVFALRKSKHFDPFYHKIRSYLQAPGDKSLVSVCRQAPSDDVTKVENQIPHWMFAMNETLATNTARALALIAAHPHAEKRVREEMAAADLLTPEGIDSLKYLEGCIQEAMRLWPTTPMLVRETVAEDRLDGAQVASKTQVLIPSNFNHRDTATYPFADTFSPEVWLSGEVNYHFNHFSNGTQVCPGEKLALFIAKAVLATLLSTDRYVLRRPRLNIGRPMPYKYNYFDLVLSRHPLAPPAPA
jgi:cytochrome P450